MPSMSLDDINEAADQRFGPFTISGVPGGDVILLNPLRMPKTKRRQLVDLQKVANQLGTDDPDAVLDSLRQIVLVAAKTKADGDRLLKAIGDDQGKLAVILQEYGKSSQQGEASPSPS